MFELKLPQINNEDFVVETNQSIIFVGANGAGKTRLGTQIELNNPSPHFFMLELNAQAV